ncbi:hypothetical protein C8F04DRAFT_1394701 [Mycena alexandri]|uniref:RanBP2-type domain-containing protein n=1 Tax=Mycena alexandri TaxID=1745969 RepID=A0AAD6SXF4_9AGAR|nr:hypothetical protein C8F04DRAFT_1394701 [Mycena alexandri]
MSGAVRSQPRRSAVRSAASLPYARRKPAPPKRSPWAIATGLLSFLNPLRRSQSPIDVDEYVDEPSVDLDDDVSDDSPPESLSARGRQMAHNLTAPPMMQQSPPVVNLLPETSSPQKNLETVKSFLEQRRGQTISPLEAEGLISLIQKSTPPEPEKPEPFRFSSSRGPHRPAKTLSKNPNGTLRWSGAGSARPTKNRYASPAFGSPSSRASSEHLVFQESPSKSTATDASPKRRRLETPPASTPPPAPRSAAPAPSPTRAAASQHFPFPISTPASSPLTPNLSKSKTMPVNPSPLRQAWGNSPASSISSGQSSPAQGTPTKAATLLTALIRDVDADVPKRSLDVRNPYQSASPVGVRVTNTHPPEAATRKRTRATGRPSVAERQKEKEAKEKTEQEQKEKEKEKEVVPPQVIMEATLPKGSKRSRPPAHFNASASLNSLAAPSLPSTRRSPRLEPQRIQAEEVEDVEEKDKEERDAGAPAAKRARGPTVNGTTTPMVNGTTKKDAPVAPPVAATAPQSFTFPASSSAPSIFGNTGDANKPMFTMGSSASSTNLSSSSNTNAGPSPSAFEFRLGPKPLATAPKEPSKLRYSFQPPPTPPPVADKPKEEKEKRALFPMDPPPIPLPKGTGFAVPSPKLAFPPASASTATASSKLDPKAAVRTMPTTALPAFVFSVLTNAPSPAAGAHVKARDAARKLDKALLPAFDFSTSGSAFTAQEKGKGKEVAPVQGFNWAAAGTAPPKPKAVEGAWTCGTCMLSNGPEAREKCSVCETPRVGAPASASTSTSASASVQGGQGGGGFNWAAAGAKPPTPKGAGQGAWTCGTCMLLNGPEVKEKCSVCDSPR